MRQEQIRLNEGVGREKRLQRRNGFRAGGGFPLERLCLVVPFWSSETSICTSRAGLNDSSWEGWRGRCVAQRAELPPDKLCSALASWVFRKEEENAIWTPGYVAPEFHFWFSERFTVNSKGAILMRRTQKCFLCSSVTVVFVVRGTPCIKVG